MRILWNTHSLFFFAYNISLISRLINHFWHCARKTCFLYGCFSFTVRHSVKGVQARSFFWSIFTRIYTVNIPIQSKCRKIRTRKFLRRNCFSFWIILLSYVDIVDYHLLSFLEETTILVFLYYPWSLGKGLQAFQKVAVAYSELCQISKMERFAKIVNRF